MLGTVHFLSRRCKTVLFACAVVILAPAGGFTQERKLLYPRELAGKLDTVVQPLLNPKAEQLPYNKLTAATNYYVRIAPKSAILNDQNEILDTAILGTRPFVFVTTPDSIQGRSLLTIYEDIGYEGADIIRWQRNLDMVAIVFRFPDAVTRANVTDGTLPDDWETKAYVPTWANMFSLFSRLAEKAEIDPTKKGQFAPTRLFFASEAERQLVVNFPSAGKRRIQKTDYAVLKATDGADWVYRELLENKLSVFAHFRGNGRTHNVVMDPGGLNPEDGLIEMVGPNQRVKALPEVAVIGLGRLLIEQSVAPAPTKP